MRSPTPLLPPTPAPGSMPKPKPTRSPSRAGAGAPPRRLGTWGVRLLQALLLVLVASGCAAPQAGALLGAGPVDLPPRAVLADVPFHPQEDFQCGPAALAMVLGQAGHAVPPETLRDAVFVPARSGSFTVEMLAAPRQYGLLAVRTAPELDAVLHEVAAGNPVVVFQNLSLPIMPIWHYAVLIGYDLDREQVLLHSGAEARMPMSLHAFERTWARGEYWAMTVTAPGRLPARGGRIEVAQAAAALERVAPAAGLSAYEAMLARWPADRLALFGRGNALYALHRTADAAAAWQATVEAAPEFADAWNNLAQARSELGEREAAAAAIERALALGGPRAAVYEQTRMQINRQR